MRNTPSSSSTGNTSTGAVPKIATEIPTTSTTKSTGPVKKFYIKQIPSTSISTGDVQPVNVVETIDCFYSTSYGDDDDDDDELNYSQIIEEGKICV